MKFHENLCKIVFLDMYTNGTIEYYKYCHPVITYFWAIDISKSLFVKNLLFFISGTLFFSTQKILFKKKLVMYISHISHMSRIHIGKHICQVSLLYVDPCFPDHYLNVMVPLFSLHGDMHFWSIFSCLELCTIWLVSSSTIHLLVP